MTLETFFAVGALTTAFGMLFSRLRSKQLRPVFLVSTVVCLAAGTTIGWVAVRDHRSSIDTEPPDRPIETAREGYITSDSCKSCHPRHYGTWHGSYHRTMTQVASPETVIGNFDDVSVESEGHTYRLFRRGEEFWVEMDHLEFRSITPGRTGRIERQIVQTTGSHHMQVYWFPSGSTRTLEQLPIVWLKTEQRWTPRNACFLGPPNYPPSTEPGRWNGTCIGCHTTRGRPQIISPTEMYTDTTEFGIACEACHGPAENHVAIHGNPARRYQQWLNEGDDSSIVNPLQLPAPLDSQVCGQCHSLRRALSSRHQVEYDHDGIPFQPGEDLTQKMLVPRLQDTLTDPSLIANDPNFAEGHFWSDGMIRVSGREYHGLIESPCFSHDKSDRKMSCFSCHSMHQGVDDPRARADWADDQLKPGMRTDEACLQCHDDFRADITGHTRHKADSFGSRCLNCHMPHTSYGLLKAIRSHQVSVPTARESVETGRPNACNLCHLDKTLAWTADRLHEWFDIEKPPLSKDQKTIAAAALWLLKGDAGQRALIAWSMSWKPAQQASRTDWLPLFLGQTLIDPYDAVRFIAGRSLRAQPGYSDLSYDYVGPIEDRVAAAHKVREQWRSTHSQPPDAADQSLLINGPGQVNASEFSRLVDQRDETPLNLAE